MLMPPFELHHPNTVDEAVETAARLMKNGEAFDWVAGGTDVLPNYKWRINPKPHVISLAGIEETRTMTATELGCTVPLSSLTTENGVHPLYVLGKLCEVIVLGQVVPSFAFAYFLPTFHRLLRFYDKNGILGNQINGLQVGVGGEYKNIGQIAQVECKQGQETVKNPFFGHPS